eukprot:3433337-Karenia_brevis.AAC.1
MAGIPKTSRSEVQKVRYVSVKSDLPGFSGILRRKNRIIFFQADQMSFVSIREFPNMRRW